MSGAERARSGIPQPKIAILDYGIGNLRSVQKGLEASGAIALLTADPAVIAAADGIVLPGVGAFGSCVRALKAAGLTEVAADAARSATVGGRPFLGICVGMQMLFSGSEENPDDPGLGVLEGRVALLGDSVKRPQMQWNQLHVAPGVRAGDDSLAATSDGDWVYFVHSYAAGADAAGVVLTCDYPEPVAAAVEVDHLWATQFHPEKSGAVGLALLARFVDRCGAPIGAVT